MHIHQLSLSYVNEQDRILVRINSTTADEFRLWLTRRMALRLIPLLDKIAADQMARKGSPDTSHLIGADEATRRMMSEFEGSDALKQADFSTPYDSAARNLPLGVEPLLVTDISFTPKPKDLIETVFTEKASVGAEPRCLRILVDMNLTHSFIHMLKRSIGQAQWDAVAGVAGGQGKVSEVGSAVKPKYLN